MDFEIATAAAEALAIEGWDLAPLRGHARMDAHPWDYVAEVKRRLAVAETLLDIGTGDGALLASMAPLPKVVTATEGYAPMVPIARARLAPLGVTVVATDIEPLPFADQSFDAIVNARAYFTAGEVARLLKPGGWFITEQVAGGNDRELYEHLLGATIEFEPDASWMASELASLGLCVTDVREALIDHHFLDIWGVVYYLRLISWQLPDFSVARYRNGLESIHRRILEQGEFVAKSRRYLLIATRD